MISQKLTAPKTGGGTLVLATTYGVYDGVNRMTWAAETGGTSEWTHNYSYAGDGSNGQFGNLWQTGDGLPSGLTCLTYSSSTNRCTDAGVGYDATGNLTAYGSRTLTYDAENRQKTLTDSGTTTVYVYDAMGRLASEYDSTPLGNQPDCVTCFLTADHLGSTRLVTDGVTGQVKRRYDYHPFGWEVNPGYGDRTSVTGYTTTDWSNPKFTGNHGTQTVDRVNYSFAYTYNADGSLKTRHRRETGVGAESRVQRYIQLDIIRPCGQCVSSVTRSSRCETSPRRRDTTRATNWTRCSAESSLTISDLWPPSARESRRFA